MVSLMGFLSVLTGFVLPSLLWENLNKLRSLQYCISPVFTQTGIVFLSKFIFPANGCQSFRSTSPEFYLSHEVWEMFRCFKRAEKDLKVRAFKNKCSKNRKLRNLYLRGHIFPPKVQSFSADQ